MLLDPRSPQDAGLTRVLPDYRNKAHTQVHNYGYCRHFLENTSEIS